jgi:APA family basic amino acid/polyamine antiporter
MSEGRRRLSLVDATFLVMGAILGVGIFFNPQQVAALVPSQPAFLATWAAGCVVALCGAFTFAELAATWPEAGGSFVYLREIYGRPAAFLLAWVVLFVISTGAMAVMVGFGAAMLVQAVPAVGAWGASLGLSEQGTNRALGAALIVSLHALALGGAKTGATFQNLIMGVKLLLVVLVVGGAWLLFAPAEAPAPPPLPEAGPLWRGMTLAMLPVLFSCGGWPLVSYISSEIEDPARNLPRALVLGVGGVVVIYLTLNLAYLRVVGLGGVAADPGFAGEVVGRTFGASAGAALTLGMAVSAVGVTLVNVLTSPWLYVAMAREGLFFGSFARLHAGTGAPVAGLVVQAALALAYLFLADADFLVDSVVFVEWLFHVLIAGGLLWLRARRAELPRPYRSPAYPLLPLVYALFAVYLVVATVWQNDREKTLVGGGIALLGLVVFGLWQRVARPRSAA